MSERKQLLLVVEQLGQRRTEILREWKRRSEEDMPPGQPLLTRNQFYDHIPDFLDLLERRLQDYAEGVVTRRTHAPWMPDLPEMLRQHGRERWHQGFHLGSLVRDWYHLRGAVFHQLEEVLDAEPCTPEGLRIIYGVIGELITTGVSESVSQFEQLRQAEAQSRLVDLEQHLEVLDRVGRTQRESVLQVAHDLSGNLAILSKVTRRLREIGPDEQNGRLTDVLLLGLESALRLLDEVRELTSLEARDPELEVERINVARFVHQASAPFMTVNEHGPSVLFKGDEQLEVQADTLKLARILQNLLHNAFKFTPRGEIAVEWRVVSRELWCLTIRNTHTRRPSRAPFPEYDHEVEGEGLGLGIVSRMCEALRGQFHLSDDEGGMIVRVLLPREYPPAALKAQAARTVALNAAPYAMGQQ
ncbi:MAG: sensor histidine kinase [Verrucomicrobiota bacterium JB022]|nr:sensor histidine kinase [Verrucomicrobiota bacterium JB022]